MKKKIAYIVDGVPHPSKDSVLRILHNNYPDYQIDTINVLSILKKKKVTSLINMYYVFKEYWKHYIKGEKKILFYFMRTTYIFRKVKKIVNEIVRKEGYSFSFQMMLMFDASTPGVPHFVYTDIVHLFYFDLPVFNVWHQNHKKWIEMEKDIYSNAVLNFPWSSNIRKLMIEKYGITPEKIADIYIGGNANFNVALALNDERYKSKNILFVGKDWERKGGPQLVEAFKLVLEKHKDATLTIVGCSPDVNIANCNIVGKIPVEKVGVYFEKAAVFCLPTLIEPFGIVFIEAMAYKLPVVALDLGAVPDMVVDGRNGYKVEPLNIQELAERLIELISDPAKCRDFGRYGYNLARERYSWDKVAAKMKFYMNMHLLEQSYGSSGTEERSYSAELKKIVLK